MGEMRNDALHSFAKQIALRVRPLEERLKERCG